MSETMKEKILIVEDGAAIRESLEFNLEKAGYVIESVADGRAALEAVRKGKPNLLVLDLMIPEIDGFDVTRILRAESHLPILMLTARDDEIDRVLGLELGADDYLTKPFSMRELIARVKAMLRRESFSRSSGGAGSKEELESGDIRFDEKRHEVSIGGDIVEIKPKEYELLAYFLRHKGQVLSRDKILEEVWGWEYGGGSRTVDVHVRWLRSKIENDPENPDRIVTVRGVGYRFEG